ncbi:MAG: nicotinate-nucleotide adenylyltransferase [Candidatus Ratteibacteria bacterium]|jgi:nicotinate-nucleotide adenylyltransferase
MDRSEANRCKDLSVERFGIFGGSFDPIHIGHLFCAEYAREEFRLDRIFFVPSGIPPHRGAPRASASFRCEMVRLAIMDNPFFSLWDAEILSQEVSYSYETVMRLKSLYPSGEAFFLIGRDAFSLLDQWHRIEELVKEVTFLVAAREGSDLKNPSIQSLSERINNPYISISATMIRKKILQNRSIRYLVPDSVADFIEKEKPYG